MYVQPDLTIIDDSKRTNTVFIELRWRIFRGLAPEVSADHGGTPFIGAQTKHIGMKPIAT